VRGINDYWLTKSKLAIAPTAEYLATTE